MMNNFGNHFEKKLGLLLALAILTLVDSSQLRAQNVTIRANNGSMIAVKSKQGYEDVGFKSGGFATWQHNQLSMVLTTSDGSKLTHNDQLDTPANNIYADGDKIQIVKGELDYGYVSISLPKGYRFTGYSITFKKPNELTKGSDGNTITYNKDNYSSTFGETDKSYTKHITQATADRGGEAVTISRSENGSEDVMSNVLYFKLGNEHDYAELITIENAEFTFTSEDNYTPVIPVSSITEKSAVDIPFNTSKVDYGSVESNLYHDNNRISYDGNNLKDLEASFVLYEQESLTDGSGIDDITGKIVDYKSGSISSAGRYFKLGKESQEQIYYIESPTYVELSNGTKNPVGYRIIDAEFEYTKSVVDTTRTMYITYKQDNYTTYYLSTKNGKVTWPDDYSKRSWYMDKDGYIYTYENSTCYYLYFNNGYAGVQTTKPGDSERFGINENNEIYQLKWPTYFLRYYSYKINERPTREVLISNTTGENAKCQILSTETSTFNADDYTLYIYDKEGANPQEINVNSSNKSGKVSLTGLNNDAVKFGVKGIGLVRATLTLQALDPYLDDLNVVCSTTANTDKDISVQQTFHASDFSVNGGEFYFYLPSDLKNEDVKITFKDLYSGYFDETYTGGNAKNHSRLSFVKSEHYNAFGASSNNIYNDTNEAKDAQKERLQVETVGTAAFKFNNADEVGTSGGTLTEYPFSLEKYKNGGGEFKEMTFNVSETDQQQKGYVFTTDETRYNIAPTTATQHRTYAFYEMTVHVQSKEYEPKVKFTKVYDKTYRTGQANEAFYGAEVTTNKFEDNEYGYASTTAIFKKINECIENKKDDFSNTDCPADQKHLLYLDFSKLKGVYQILDGDHKTMDDFSKENASNCLIFVPTGSSAQVNNVAEKKADGTYKAARDIVLKDKEPFYTPYDIQVDAANKAKHERLITNAKNGKVTKATIIMPFDILINENGEHYNVDESGNADLESEPAFSLHTMQATNCITDVAPSDADEESVASYAFFPTLNSVKATEPNKPYIVKVLKQSDGDQTTFVITQKGALIKATTNANGMNDDYTFNGEEAKGTVNGTSYTFTNKGTFSGIQVDKHGGYYYFAQNKFVCSNDLVDPWTVVGIYPFRAYYSTGTQNASNLMSTFAIVFSDGDIDPNGIDNVNETPDLVVAPGVGTVTMASTKEQDVKIYNMNGMLTDKVVIGAGETQTVNIPSGMYIVNGTKIMVR